MSFDAKQTTDAIVDYVRAYFAVHGLGGAVLGISGGKDSAVAAALLCKALGPDKLVGLALPCHSSPQDEEDARLIADTFSFQLEKLELSGCFDALTSETDKVFQTKDQHRENSDINAKPRLRMTAMYYVAALLSAQRNEPYIVIGASNKSESFVGYFTKWGDGAWDLALLLDLTVAEVIAIGAYLNVPDSVLYKTPSDGISAQSDEEKLGVSYEDIALYMQDPGLAPVDSAIRIARLHAWAGHKFRRPYYRRS